MRTSESLLGVYRNRYGLVLSGGFGWASGAGVLTAVGRRRRRRAGTAVRELLRGPEQRGADLPGRRPQRRVRRRQRRPLPAGGRIGPRPLPRSEACRVRRRQRPGRRTDAGGLALGGLTVAALAGWGVWSVRRHRITKRRRRQALERHTRRWPPRTGLPRRRPGVAGPAISERCERAGDGRPGAGPRHGGRCQAR